MIIATGLELAMLAVLLGASDFRTRVMGGVLWCAYLRYSATRTALEALAEWLHDRNNPPGGPA
jgi:hypothetical protein